MVYSTEDSALSEIGTITIENTLCNNIVTYDFTAPIIQLCCCLLPRYPEEKFVENQKHFFDFNYRIFKLCNSLENQ